MSPASFLLVLAIMWLPVVAIYAVLFSVGSGLGTEDERVATPAERESQPERHEFPHAA